MLAKGDEVGFEEPVGVVLLYKDSGFLKAVWTKDANRADIGNGLIDAAADEMSKA
jgi:hypothetical protein